MSDASRKLQPGAWVVTDFATRGTDKPQRLTRHQIVARQAMRNCQGGVAFQVSPAVPKSGGPDAWISADWFEPAEAP